MRPALCHVFPAFGHGGPEVRTSLLMSASAGEFAHTVVSINGELAGRVRVGGDVSFEALAGGNRVLALRRRLAELRPDLVLTYGWGGTDALAAARLAGLHRLVHTEDGFLPDEAAGQKYKRVLARRVLLRLAACVVCPSRNLQRLARHSWWLPTKQIVYLPNGVDTERFAPGRAEALRRELGVQPDEVVVGTCGHLRAEKNQARLLEAFAALGRERPAKLLLLGDGPLRQELARRADELGLGGRVIFTGVVPAPQEHYRAMDVFALSSDTEQMPLALLEAMASGLPAVSTAVGDVGDMVAEANRPLVTPLGRDDLFAANLRLLVGDAAARRRLGEANRARCVAEYALGDSVRAYLRLYREVLTAGRPPRGERQRSGA